MTVKDYLEYIVMLLNKSSDKKYVLRKFSYPVVYESYGTKHDFPLEVSKPRYEEIVAIMLEDFDYTNMFQGYLCYPEEYPGFYKKSNFILVYGPSSKEDEVQEFLEDDFNKYSLNNFFGLPHGIKVLLKEDVLRKVLE